MKNCQEWSISFDQLYNNITSNKAPGLNRYEKSRFLTDAQDVIVLGLCNGSFGKPYESSEDVSSFLAALVRQETMEEVVTEDIKRIDTRSTVYKLPDGADEILFKTLEVCKIAGDCKDADGEPVIQQAIVVPVTQDEYWRTVRNPFKRANGNRVLRLSNSSKSNTETGNLSVEKYFELISDRPIKEYIVRYIGRPKPIILEDLKESDTAFGLTIHGQWRAQTCLLDDALHQAILNEAVRMAKAAWQN